MLLNFLTGKDNDNLYGHLKSRSDQRYGSFNEVSS